MTFLLRFSRWSLRRRRGRKGKAIEPVVMPPVLPPDAPET